MSELGELYAACIVEYAGSQSKGTLAGNFMVFGKDARDAFNLPYHEDTFRDAFAVLKRVGALTEHKLKGVPTWYSVRRSDFDNAMIVEGTGRRRFESSASYASGAAASLASILGTQRQPSLLESYADLGSEYLIDLLQAFEPQLVALSAEDAPVETGGDGQRAAILPAYQVVPASDRLVLASDNLERAIAARDATARLLAQLDVGNDVGELTAEDVQLARREVWLLQQAIAEQALRVDWVESLAKTSLKWVAEKAAGSAVGDLAVAALLAIAKWLEFTT